MGIQFNAVGYKYKGFTKAYDAINDINLSICEQNEFIAIIGQTGSGKSTLVQHMNALLQPTSGQVMIFDHVLPAKRKQKINHIRQKVGLLFQFPEYQLFEETVLKDIMFGPKNFKVSDAIAKEQALKASNLVGLDETLLSKSPFRISGGQMRKVAVAGVLAMNPKILVLDEPTRGLDPKAKHEIMEMFLHIHTQENKTIVMITHDMDLVSKYAKRVIVLKEGQIVFDGTKEDLFSHPKFETFHLDYPEHLKILKFLETKGQTKFKYIYEDEALIHYLKGDQDE